MNIHKLTAFLCMTAVMATLGACSSDRKDNGNHSFAGTFTDEFGNTFTLLEDYTAIIRFAGNDFADTTHWSDGGIRRKPYATIEFNGNPAHFYLKDGRLYRHEADMESPGKGTIVTYSN